MSGAIVAMGGGGFSEEPDNPLHRQQRGGVATADVDHVLLQHEPAQASPASTARVCRPAGR
jgi:hypothetical protein